jgi:single-strand DNA-binding protein
VWSNDYSPDFPDNVCNSLHRGDRITVTGAIEASAWTAQDGSIKSGITIHADDVSPSLRSASVVITRKSRVPAVGPSYGNQRARGGFTLPEPDISTQTPEDDPFAAENPF